MLLDWSNLVLVQKILYGGCKHFPHAVNLSISLKQFFDSTVMYRIIFLGLKYWARINVTNFAFRKSQFHPPQKKKKGKKHQRQDFSYLQYQQCLYSVLKYVSFGTFNWYCWRNNGLESLLEPCKWASLEPLLPKSGWLDRFWGQRGKMMVVKMYIFFFWRGGGSKQNLVKLLDKQI